MNESQTVTLLESMRDEIHQIAEAVQLNNEKMDRGFAQVDARFDVVERDIVTLKTDVSELKSDMVEVKADVAELKSDMVEVKADVADLKSDMVHVKRDLSTLKRNTALIGTIASDHEDRLQALEH